MTLQGRRMSGCSSFSSPSLSLIFLLFLNVLSYFPVLYSEIIDTNLRNSYIYDNTEDRRKLDESYTISPVPLSWTKSGTLVSVVQSIVPNSGTCFTPLSSVTLDNVLLLIGSMMDTPLNNKSPLCNNTLSWKIAPKLNTLKGTVLRSIDYGHTWSYVKTVPSLARYGAAVVTYSGADDSDVVSGMYSNNAINCRLICVIGGSYADSVNNYRLLKDTVCSKDYGENWFNGINLPDTLYGASGSQVDNLGIWLVGGLLDESTNPNIPFIEGTLDPNSCSIREWDTDESLDDYLPGGPRVGMMVTYAPSRQQLIVGGGWKLSSISSSSAPYIVSSSRNPYTDLWMSTSPHSTGWGNYFGTRWSQLTSSFPVGYELSPSVTGSQIWEYPTNYNASGPLGALTNYLQETYPPLIIRSGMNYDATFTGDVWFTLDQYVMGSVLSYNAYTNNIYSPYNTSFYNVSSVVTGNSVYQANINLGDNSISFTGKVRPLLVKTNRLLPLGDGPAFLIFNKDTNISSILTFEQTNTDMFRAYFEPCNAPISCNSTKGVWTGCMYTPYDGQCNTCNRCDGLVVTTPNTWPFDPFASKQCGTYQDVWCRTATFPSPTASVTPSASSSPLPIGVSASSTPTISVTGTRTSSATPTPSITHPPSPTATRTASPSPVLPVVGAYCASNSGIPSGYDCINNTIAFVNGYPNVDVPESSILNSATYFSSSQNNHLQIIIYVLGTLLLLSACTFTCLSLRRVGFKNNQRNIVINNIILRKLFSSSLSSTTSSLSVLSTSTSSPVRGNDKENNTPVEFPADSTVAYRTWHTTCTKRIVTNPSTPTQVLAIHSVALWFIMHGAYVIQLSDAPSLARTLPVAGNIILGFMLWAPVLASILAITLLLPSGTLFRIRQRCSLRSLCRRKKTLHSHRNHGGNKILRSTVNITVPGLTDTNTEVKNIPPESTSFFIRFPHNLIAIASLYEHLAPGVRRIGRMMAVQLVLVYLPLVITEIYTIGIVDVHRGWTLPGTACTLSDSALCLWGFVRLASRFLAIEQKHANTEAQVLTDHHPTNNKNSTSATVYTSNGTVRETIHVSAPFNTSTTATITTVPTETGNVLLSVPPPVLPSPSVVPSTILSPVPVSLNPYATINMLHMVPVSSSTPDGPNLSGTPLSSSVPNVHMLDDYHRNSSNDGLHRNVPTSSTHRYAAVPVSVSLTSPLQNMYVTGGVLNGNNSNPHGGASFDGSSMHLLPFPSFSPSHSQFLPPPLPPSSSSSSHGPVPNNRIVNGNTVNNFPFPDRTALSLIASPSLPPPPPSTASTPVTFNPNHLPSNPNNSSTPSRIFVNPHNPLPSSVASSHTHVTRFDPVYARNPLSNLRLHPNIMNGNSSVTNVTNGFFDDTETSSEEDSTLEDTVSNAPSSSAAGVEIPQPVHMEGPLSDADENESLYRSDTDEESTSKSANINDRSANQHRPNSGVPSGLSDGDPSQD